MESDVPTENIRRYRGDWLIEALVAIARGQAYWRPIPTNPTHLTGGNPGRFHIPSQTWWPDAKEDAAGDKPVEHPVLIPPESDIDYPGERIGMTPTWVRHAHAQFLEAGCLDAFKDYVKGDEAWSIAYYNPRLDTVVWGAHATAPMRTAVMIASDTMPYTPIVEQERALA